MESKFALCRSDYHPVQPIMIGDNHSNYHIIIRMDLMFTLIDAYYFSESATIDQTPRAAYPHRKFFMFFRHPNALEYAIVFVITPIYVVPLSNIFIRI